MYSDLHSPAINELGAMSSTTLFRPSVFSKARTKWQQSKRDRRNIILTSKKFKAIVGETNRAALNLRLFLNIKEIDLESFQESK